jgi:hypothetical protein
MIVGDRFCVARSCAGSGVEARFAFARSLAALRSRPSAVLGCFLMPPEASASIERRISGAGAAAGGCAGGGCSIAARLVTGVVVGAGKSIDWPVGGGGSTTGTVNGAVDVTLGAALCTAFPSVRLSAWSPPVISACGGNIHPAATPIPPHSRTIGAASANLTRRFATTRPLATMAPVPSSEAWPLLSCMLAATRCLIKAERQHPGLGSARRVSRSPTLV